MKKVAAFNDLSGFGKCSLGITLPVLSVMGVQCCSIPTAVLTSQSGYDHYYYQDLTDMIEKYTRAWSMNDEHFDAIYSGYTTCSRQISLVMDFIDSFYRKHTILLVDPVMGDDGHTYKMFSEEMRRNMIRLVRKADLITPNLTEACLLTDRPITDIGECKSDEELLKLVEDVGTRLVAMMDKDSEVIITGIKCCHQEYPVIYNQLFSDQETFLYGTPFIEKSYSGTGDLMASILCGAKMNGKTAKEALRLATDFIHLCITDTIKEDVPCREGINFEKYLYKLAPGGNL